MNFISKLIKDIREEYKRNKDNKTTIELMYINRNLRKGRLNNE